MHFASEIWSYSSATDVESGHTKFCRHVLCVRKSTNLSGIYGELGRVPLIITRKCNMIRYWLKMIKSPENSVIRIIHSMLRNDAEMNITYAGLNLAHHVKTLLQAHGFNDLRINQPENSIKYETIKQRIYDQYYQSWYSNINNSLRLFYYRIFKHNFVQEKYLDFIHKKLRILLSQFRISAHDLEIEKGRHRNIRRSERKCKLCNLNVVEIEYHFLLACPFYRNIRKKFQTVLFSMAIDNRFESLMTTENKRTILNISKYLYNVNLKRKICALYDLHVDLLLYVTMCTCIAIKYCIVS